MNFLCNWDICNFRNFKTVVCGHGIDKEKLKYIYHCPNKCLMIWPTLTTSRVTLEGILLGGDFDLVSPHAHITLGPVQFWVFKLGPVRFWVFKLDSIKGQARRCRSKSLNGLLEMLVIEKKTQNTLGPGRIANFHFSMFNCVQFCNFRFVLHV